MTRKMEGMAVRGPGERQHLLVPLAVFALAVMVVGIVLPTTALAADWPTSVKTYNYGMKDDIDNNGLIYATRSGDLNVDNEPAYCIDPGKAVGKSGIWRPASDIANAGYGNPGTDYMRIALWFGNHGPGYDKGMWDRAVPDLEQKFGQWYNWSVDSGGCLNADGSVSSEACRNRATLLIIWYVSTQDANRTRASQPAAAQQYIIDSVCNKLWPAMQARSGEVPGQDQFHVMMLGAAGGSHQRFMTYQYIPKPNPGTIQLDKDVTSGYEEITGTVGQNRANATAGNGYSLAGAEYTVYSGGKAVGTLRTGNDGKTNQLSLDPGTYTVKETKAAPHFQLNGTTYTVTVKSDQLSWVHDNGGNNPTDTPERSWVRLDKDVTKGGERLAGTEGQGVAGATCTMRTYSLAGAKYGVYSDQGCTKQVATLTTGANGVSDQADVEAGVYWVKEISPAPGFALDGGVYKVSAGVDGAWAHRDDGSNPTDTPQSDPIELLVRKVDQDGNEIPVAGAVYEVKYYDTHDQGQLDDDHCKATWTFATGKDGKVRYRNDDKTSGPDLFTDLDGNPALPLGIVTVRETYAPAGWSPEQDSNGNPVTHVIDISDSGTGVHVNASATQTTPEPKPEIATKAVSSDTNDHVTRSDRGKTITDTVSYKGLTKGSEYLMYGTLHVVSLDGKDEGTLKDADGNDVTSVATFTPQGPTGTVDVTFENVDTNPALGRKIVSFEVLKRKSGEQDATHENPGDESQAVYIPKVGTTATDSFDGDKEMPSLDQCDLDDVVAYEGLLPGREYTATATLHVVGADGSDQGELKDADGNAVTGHTTFTPDKATGTVTVRVTYDGSLLEGKTAVCYEDMTYRGVSVAIHTDITDKPQTVTTPKIGTTLLVTDGDDEGKTLSGTASELKGEIVDTVSYENLVPGTEYTVVGTLERRSLLGTDLGAATQQPVTVTFTPETANGTVDVTFTDFDGHDFQGEWLVGFEDLYKGSELVARHSDIHDDAQSVKVPTLMPTTGLGGNLPLVLAGSGIVAAGVCGTVVFLRRRTA